MGASVAIGALADDSYIWFGLAVAGESDGVTFADDRPGDIRHSVGAPAAAEGALGFRAETTFAAALAELVEGLKTAPA